MPTPCIQEHCQNAPVALPIDVLANRAAVVGTVAPRAPLQTNGSSAAMLALRRFSDQGDTTMAAAQSTVQAPPKVHNIQTDKELLFAFLDAQCRLDRVFQIPECRGGRHRELAQYPTQPHDAYRNVTILTHDLARV